MPAQPKFPYQFTNAFAVTEAIFDMSRSGKAWGSKKLDTIEPFNSLLTVSPEELKTVAPQFQDDYRAKRRNAVYEIIGALKTCGLLEIIPGTTTTNANYRATAEGRLLIEGYYFLKELKRIHGTVTKAIEVVRSWGEKSAVA